MAIQVAKSEIEAVTVYASGAIVIRTAQLSPIDGVWPDQLRITGLPLSLEDASVRVHAEAGEGAAQAVGFRVGLEVRDDAALQPPDETALQEARREVLTLEARVKDLDRLTSRLTKMTLPSRPPGAEGEAPPPSPHTMRLNLIDFQQERLRSLSSASLDSKEKLRVARERLAGLEERKQRSTSAREARQNELRKTLLITLRAAASQPRGPMRLRFEYRVPGARWAPAYSLHFDADWSRTSLSIRAVVAQRTGEDWRGVRLNLSTAQMHSWTELPELTSLRLGRWQPPPKSGWRSPPTGVEELFADYDRETRKNAPSFLDTIADATPVAATFAPPTVKVPMLPAPSQREPGEFTSRFLAASAPLGPTGAPAPKSAAHGEFTRMFAAFAPPPPPPPPAPAQDEAALESVTRFSRARPRVPADATTVTVPATLDFAALRMPGADDAGRGKLTSSDLATRLEIFTHTRAIVHVNTVAVIHQALAEAVQLGDLPAAHAFPSSIDGFDYAYRAELPADIPSDGQFHSVPLLTGEAQSHLYYVTVPRAAASVFRFTDIVNPLDAPLLPGPADVYCGEAFLMTAPLRLTPAKGVIKLGLGVEQRIKVARNTTFAEEATGIMSGNLNLKHEIHIEIRNLLRTAAQVEVRERVPVARNGDEQVRLSVTARPQWESYEPTEGSLRGGYVWKITVKPAEAVQLLAAYTITLPSKMEIAAGNRREQ